MTPEEADIAIIRSLGRDICEGCRNEIDPEVCHCGDLCKDHNPMMDGHSAIPMGCTCGYADQARTHRGNHRIFTRSLDLCAEFEATLSGANVREYDTALVRFAGFTWQATAPQRCEAYLRTIGKWVE